MSDKKDLIAAYWTRKVEESEEPISEYWSSAPNAEVPERN